MRLFLFILILLSACSPANRIGRVAKQQVLKDSALRTAHVGISIYDPATGKYLYNYNGDKYFVPASNTKLPTLYAGMKFLGDSLIGFYEGEPEQNAMVASWMFIRPAGDPTFLHPDFRQQRTLDLLKTEVGKRKLAYTYISNNKVDRWGSGWAWNDYESDYMAERSVFPILGNVIKVGLRDTAQRIISDPVVMRSTIRLPFITNARYFDSLLNNGQFREQSDIYRKAAPGIRIERSIDANNFVIHPAAASFRNAEIPFVTAGSETSLRILSDTLHTTFRYVEGRGRYFALKNDDGDFTPITISRWRPVYSQPTDSMLKPMMHRSDNFFAEQTLLMASDRAFGIMDESRIIDSLLKTDFADLPQKPRWVDGSGLSRYNLFTPQDMVAIIQKLHQQFGAERLRTIMATGNEGTLTNYYKKDSGYLYAKTGTLSGVVALSGFMYTKGNKLLFFSVLVNNHNASASAVRRAVERFIGKVREEN